VTEVIYQLCVIIYVCEYICIWILRECLFVYVEHNNKLERGLWERYVSFVTEVIYQLCVIIYVCEYIYICVYILVNIGACLV